MAKRPPTFVKQTRTAHCDRDAQRILPATDTSEGLVTLTQIAEISGMHPGPPGPPGPPGSPGPTGPGMSMDDVSDVLAINAALSDGVGNFTQIGNGIATGFPIITAVLTAGIWMCRYTLDCSASAGAVAGQFRLNFNGAIPAQAIAHRFCPVGPAREVISAFVNLGVLAAGNYDTYVEWADDESNSLAVDVQSALRIEFFKIG